MKPEKPVVLVTGASRGLGRAIALAFAKSSYTVAIHYHQNLTEAQSTAGQVFSLGQSSLLLKADMRSSAEVNAMIKKATDELGRIDVLVNNAGSVANRTIAKMSDDEWRSVINVNLDGPFFATRALIPVFRKQGGGSIINLASYIAPRGAKGAANYAAAKAGLITLTKTTAIEEGSHNIRANVVMPGFHVTDINKDVWGKFENDIRAQHLLPTMPDRDEMAAFTVKIAELKTVTGQVFAFESRLL